MTVFGTFRSAEDAEEAILDSLQEWMPTYLREIERQRGLTTGDLGQVRSYATVTDYDRWPQEQLPAVQVASAGLVNGSLTKDGSGSYTGRYTVEVSVTVGGPRAVPTRQASQRYAQAIRGVLLQANRDLGNGVEVAEWTDEGFSGEGDDRETRVTTVQTFEVEVTDLGRTGGGPSAPNLAPGPWPTVATTDVDIERETA